MKKLNSLLLIISLISTTQASNFNPSYGINGIAQKAQATVNWNDVPLAAIASKESGHYIWVNDQQSQTVADSIYKLKGDGSLDNSFGRNGRVDGINAVYSTARDADAVHQITAMSSNSLGGFTAAAWIGNSLWCQAYDGNGNAQINVREVFSATAHTMRLIALGSGGFMATAVNDVYGYVWRINSSNCQIDSNYAQQGMLQTLNYWDAKIELYPINNGEVALVQPSPSGIAWTRILANGSIDGSMLRKSFSLSTPIQQILASPSGHLAIVNTQGCGGVQSLNASGNLSTLLTYSNCGTKAFTPRFIWKANAVMVDIDSNASKPRYEINLSTAAVQVRNLDNDLTTAATLPMLLAKADGSYLALFGKNRVPNAVVEQIDASTQTYDQNLKLTTSTQHLPNGLRTVPITADRVFIGDDGQMWSSVLFGNGGSAPKRYGLIAHTAAGLLSPGFGIDGNKGIAIFDQSHSNAVGNKPAAVLGEVAINVDGVAALAVSEIDDSQIFKNASSTRVSRVFSVDKHNTVSTYPTLVNSAGSMGLTWLAQNTLLASTFNTSTQTLQTLEVWRLGKDGNSKLHELIPFSNIIDYGLPLHSRISAAPDGSYALAASDGRIAVYKISRYGVVTRLSFPYSDWTNIELLNVRAMANGAVLAAIKRDKVVVLLYFSPTGSDNQVLSINLFQYPMIAVNISASGSFLIATHERMNNLQLRRYDPITVQAIGGMKTAWQESYTNLDTPFNELYSASLDGNNVQIASDLGIYQANFPAENASINRAAIVHTAVEYTNPNNKHYFVSAFADEVKALDTSPPWQRTGLGFNVSDANKLSGLNTVPVCRFYSAKVNTHFYTADNDECGSLKLDANWSYEGIAFRAIPSLGGKRCPTGSTAVYRSFNQRQLQLDSNHRFATDAGMLKAMTGWRFEDMAFCAPD
ncbi:MAG: hypothetical protein RLZZ502_574 [Pseudomonadota bacterium]|jgi:hypothetical protein